MYLVILLYALFASIFTLSKHALDYTEPFFFIGSRMLFAGILLLSYQVLWKKQKIKLNKTQIKTYVLFGVMASYLTNIAEIWATQFLPSSKVCLLYSLSPFLSALIAYIILHEKLSLKKWVGLSIGFIGLLPITLLHSTKELSNGRFLLFSYPELAMLIAVICSVYGWVLLKKIMTEFKHSPLLANGIGMTLGGSLALLHSYFSHEAWSPVPVREYLPFLKSAIAVCFISNIICYNLYGALLKRFSATFMSFAGLITPVFALLFGWIFLNETVTWPYIAAIVIFCLGLTLFYQEELKSK